MAGMRKYTYKTLNNYVDFKFYISSWINKEWQVVRRETVLIFSVYKGRDNNDTASIAPKQIKD